MQLTLAMKTNTQLGQDSVHLCGIVAGGGTLVDQTDHELIFGKTLGDVDDNYAKGGIDELLIFEEILSAADVNAVYMNS